MIGVTFGTIEIIGDRPLVRHGASYEDLSERWYTSEAAARAAQADTLCEMAAGLLDQATTIQCMAVVDAALAQPAGVTVGQLCERLECHPKTVRRYLAWLRRTFGVSIRYVGGEGRERKYVYPNGQRRIFTLEAVRALEKNPPGGDVR